MINIKRLEKFNFTQSLDLIEWITKLFETKFRKIVLVKYRIWNYRPRLNKIESITQTQGLILQMRIHKGFYVVIKLVWNVRIKAFCTVNKVVYIFNIIGYVTLLFIKLTTPWEIVSSKVQKCAKSNNNDVKQMIR